MLYEVITAGGYGTPPAPVLLKSRELMEALAQQVEATEPVAVTDALHLFELLGNIPGFTYNEEKP